MDHAPTRQAALDAVALGYDVTLLAEGSKRPWRKGWNETPMGAAELDYWLRHYPLNYGILLRGLCVLDKDGRSATTTAFLKEHAIRSPVEVRTKRGTHVYLRLPDAVRDVRTRIRWLGLGLDVKMTGCVVGCGSTIAETGWTYRLKSGKRVVPKESLPLLPDSVVALLQAETPAPPSSPLSSARGEAGGRVRDAEAYCLRIESHQGAHGSAGLVRAVCVLRDAGRSARETFDFLRRHWNGPPRVTPPWSEAELAYAVNRHFQPKG